MLTFAVAVFLLLITPGPGVLTIAGVGSAYGYKPGLVYLIGLAIGNNMVAFTVISGLAAVLTASPILATILVFASIGYLLYLAAKIAFSGSKIAFIRADKAPGIIGGITLQAINPKAYVVLTTLFGSFHFMQENMALEIITKLALFNLIWIPIHLIWLSAGVSINRLNLAPQKQRAINMAMALAMIMVVVLAFAFKN